MRFELFSAEMSTKKNYIGFPFIYLTPTVSWSICRDIYCAFRSPPLGLFFPLTGGGLKGAQKDAILCTLANLCTF